MPAVEAPTNSSHRGDMAPIWVKAACSADRAFGASEPAGFRDALSNQDMSGSVCGAIVHCSIHESAVRANATAAAFRSIGNPTSAAIDVCKFPGHRRLTPVIPGRPSSLSDLEPTYLAGRLKAALPPGAVVARLLRGFLSNDFLVLRRRPGDAAVGESTFAWADPD